MSFADSLIVTVVSMSVVFVVLVVIALLISLMQRLLGEKQQASAPVFVVDEAVEEVAEEDFGEIVAAIVAAISMSEGNASGFKVNTIKRLNDARDAWKNAGIKEQINK